MSYKSLLFCPDEGTARTVTQVLTELEFEVEPANEPFAAVKKLADTRFDALVVDCQNEQDAALLFKTARDSGQNHSSLSVAIVEGQTGVAKAFRIGANLVLTKPINVEQSKGTLRVARGLLRKHETKPAPAAAPAQKSVPAGASLQKPYLPGAGSQAEPSYSIPAKAEAPFAAIEAESEPAPATTASEAAVLESLPSLDGKISRSTPAEGVRSHAEPIAAGASGQAAAVAPALEKTPILGLNTGSAAPMVTNQPIVPEKHFDQPIVSEPVEVPHFASLETVTRQSSGGTKIFKYAAILFAGILAGFFGWRKLAPLKYLHSPAAQTTTSAAPSSSETAANLPTQPAASSEAAAPGQMASSTAGPEDEISVESRGSAPQNDKIESIEVQELPLTGEPKPAPKADPLIVKPDALKKPAAKSPQAAAPTVMISAASGPDSALNALAAPSPTLPTLAVGSMRISQGISQGLLLKKVAPVYPPMALQVHKEGSVEVLATISRQGAVTNTKLLNGDPMFTRAALDAVRQWKYRPYLLNGEPVEIQTQITISFKLPK